MKFTYALPISCLATLALSATVDVTVGPGLSYTPNNVTAAQGDVVRFRFGSGHDVVSGDFNSPCQPNGMIYSGMPNSGDVFSVTVNNTNPIWIYCSVSRHCEGGMAMVINPPSNANINDYKQAAAKASSSNSPNNVIGGVLNAQSSTSNSSSSATSTSGATSTSTTAQASSTSMRSSASKTLSSSSSTIGSALVALAVAFGLGAHAW